MIVSRFISQTDEFPLLSISYITKSIQHTVVSITTYKYEVMIIFLPRIAAAGGRSVRRPLYCNVWSSKYKSHGCYPLGKTRQSPRTLHTIRRDNRPPHLTWLHVPGCNANSMMKRSSSLLELASNVHRKCISLLLAKQAESKHLNHRVWFLVWLKRAPPILLSVLNCDYLLNRVQMLLVV